MCPHFPSVKSFQINLQKSCRIETFSSDLVDIPKDWPVDQLLEFLPHLLPEENTPSKEEKLEQNIYSEIADLYSNSEYSIHLNETCSRIRFDKFSQNEHYLEVALPSLQILEHSLPVCMDWQEMLGKSASLTALVQQFCKYLEDLRPFYENFADIDELCHVVQPSLPTTKENWRLFVLKERVFLKLQFNDPFSPLNSMSVHIIGPTSEVTNLRRTYSDGLRDWDGELDVHKNLLRIFDLCFFPMPPTENSESSLQFCNICYCYKLERGEIPIVSCDNPNCSLIYHAACLKEWFNTLADGKTFLDVSFGACPFCKAVSVFLRGKVERNCLYLSALFFIILLQKLSTSFQEILE